MPIDQTLRTSPRKESGITGLETAILLIAFVVVASVLSYTVLSTGLFATQESSEAVTESLEVTQATLNVKGSAIARKESIDTTGNRAGDTDGVVSVTVNLDGSLSGGAIEMAPAYTQHATQNKLLYNDAAHKTVVNFSNEDVHITDCAWTASFIGGNDGDNLLENGEKISLTVWLIDYDYHPSVGNYYELGNGEDDPFLDDAADLLQPDSDFCLEILPDKGAALTIDRRLPATFDATIDLK